MWFQYSLIRRLASYKVCLCFIVLSVTVCTIGYVCLFRGDQIFVDFVTADGERFAGLNVRIFNPIEVFADILLHCLGGQKCLLFSIIKESHLYLRESFAVLLKTVKTQMFNPANLSPFTVVFYPWSFMYMMFKV